MMVMGIFIGLINYGNQIGKKALYVYFAGCNRKCLYCNITNKFYKVTNFRNYKFPRFSVDELLYIIDEYGIENVVLTGGEPCIQKDIIPLVKKLNKKGYYSIIETNAKKFYDVLELPSEVIINLKTYSAGVPYSIKEVIDDIILTCNNVSLTCLINDVKDFDSLVKYKDYDVWCFLEFNEIDFSEYVYHFLTNSNWRMIIRYDKIFKVDFENSYRRAKNANKVRKCDTE